MNQVNPHPYIEHVFLTDREGVERYRDLMLDESLDIEEVSTAKFFYVLRRC